MALQKGGGARAPCAPMLDLPMDNYNTVNKIRHTMAQIASSLAVATVFIGLWTLIFIIFYSQGKWGGLYAR